MNVDFKRATGLLILEVVNSNPNGDPDRENDPRQRPNGLGEISPVSVKRKVRDLVEDHDGVFFQSLPEEYISQADRFCILESRGRDITAVTQEMNDSAAFMDSTFVKKYWDARVFGNTFLEKGMNKECIKTGAVQFGMGLSISPISIVRHTNTKKAGVEEGKSIGMAPLAYRVVEHGVYCMPFYVNPNYAAKSGCTAADIELLKRAIPYTFDLTRSNIRPDVRLRHAWYMEHKNRLGSCPDYLLIDALTPKRIGSAEEPSASWQDYKDIVDLPEELKQRLASVRDLANIYG